jgi:glyoxylate reductase
LKKWSAYLTREILSPAISILSKDCTVILGSNKGEHPPIRKQLLKQVRQKDAILCTLSDRIDAKVMDAAGSNLKVISSYSTGVDHIDVKEATKRGIYVTCTGDILTEATADLTFALMLAISRRITQGHELVIDKRWKYGWDPHLLLGSDVHGTTIGILGLGRIGSAVARRAKGFNMNIIYHNRHNRKNLLMEDQVAPKYVDMDDLIKESDFLSIHCSLNSESYHLIDKPKLKQMKKSSYVINTARGQIINETHLIGALKQSWISGAGLDVFEKEPPLSDNPLLKMNNVILSPHIGSATLLTRRKMAEVSAKNLLNVLNQKNPIYLANPEVINDVTTNVK